MEEQSPLRVMDETSTTRRGIGRREMVRRLLGGAGAGLALPGVVGAHPVHKHLANAATLAAADAKAAAADWQPEFLDPHQNETLIVLAERIIPGSTRAQVNRFIDLLLSVDTQARQKEFINSLSTIDAASLAHFQSPFEALTEAQQNELLTVASTDDAGHAEAEKIRSWFADPPSSTEQPRLTLRRHFENLKGWISGAYYSSEIGMRELGWTGDVMFESFPGCQHPGGHH